MKAPIVIGRDHLDTGSVASPYRETEAMSDGSDAIADWPILNALLNTAAGAHWVSFHHGGGVGIGYSLHAGMVVVADGSDDARERLACVLTTDSGMGVVRHADAGYEERDRNGRRKGHRLASLIVRARTIVTCDTDAPQCGIDFAALGPHRRRRASLIEDGTRDRDRAALSDQRATATTVDLRDCVIVPGFVDAHAHPLFAGDREPDFAARLRGERRPLGMRLHGRANARSAARPGDVLRSDGPPATARRCSRHGTTTLETKTGYALHSPASPRCSI